MTPERLRKTLCYEGLWREDSFEFIIKAMFEYRPCLSLYTDNGRRILSAYEYLTQMACEYADTMRYPWIKSKLKDIVCGDFKGFYETLANLVRDGRKTTPFDPQTIQIIGELGTIWVRISVSASPSQSWDSAVAPYNSAWVSGNTDTTAAIATT